MKSPGPSEHFRPDRYSAVVTLFHDHDWELPYLAQAVRQDTLFIGAMGSPATHVRRRAALADLGIEPEALDRIVGPIGLIPATRDPATLALSALAQVVTAYQAARGQDMCQAKHRIHAAPVGDDYDDFPENIRHAHQN